MEGESDTILTRIKGIRVALYGRGANPAQPPSHRAKRGNKTRTTKKRTFSFRTILFANFFGLTGIYFQYKYFWEKMPREKRARFLFTFSNRRRPRRRIICFCDSTILFRQNLRNWRALFARPHSIFPLFIVLFSNLFAQIADNILTPFRSEFFCTGE